MEEGIGLRSFKCAAKQLKTDCNDETEFCPKIVTCNDMDHCIGVWQNDSSGHMKPTYQDCWNRRDMNCEQAECIARKHEKDSSIFTCCCNTSMCNKNLQYIPEDNSTVKTDAQSVSGSAQEQGVFTVVMVALVPICLIAIIICVGYWLYRRSRNIRPPPGRKTYANINVTSKQNKNSLLQSQELKLLEIKAKGRFGVVWRADFGGKIVAVKTFPPQDEYSWLQEQKIYNSAGLKEHPNVLKYLCAQEPGHTLDKEYCIVTEYAIHGSLYDYLKGYIISVDDMLCIGAGLMRGLAFLHEERVSGDRSYKASIVHRDFKSKNVLLKQDLTPCVADFGLALLCMHDAAPDAHGQVGTRRYMAPEVLEGATEFNAFAFRQIDVYAAALVLWELMSRTYFSDGGPVPDYKLPFEDEVGLHPSIGQMLACVVHSKKRPTLREQWHRERVLAAVCDTLEDMWDHESEARLTAAGALERLESFGIAKLVACSTDVELTAPLIV